jgi:hypothetical protein
MPEVKATQKLLVEVVSVRFRWFKKPVVTLRIAGMGIKDREVNVREKDRLYIETECKHSFQFPPGTRVEFTK